MSDLTTILSEATEGSRELDAAICDLLLEPVFKPLSGARLPRWPLTEGTPLAEKTPRVTTSLDAALALAERVLPGCEVWVGNLDGRWEADCEPKGAEPDARFVDHRGATPAIAMCIAILRATAHQKETTT